jgi:hypothetical protein
VRQPPQPGRLYLLCHDRAFAVILNGRKAVKDPAWTASDMSDQNATTYTGSAPREILHPAEAGLTMTSNSFGTSGILLRFNSLLIFNPFLIRRPKHLDSPYFSQLRAQLVGGAEQRVFDRPFGGIQHSGYRPQSHPVVVLQFEHHPFPRRKLPQSADDRML